MVLLVVVIMSCYISAAAAFMKHDRVCRTQFVIELLRLAIVAAVAIIAHFVLTPQAINQPEASVLLLPMVMMVKVVWMVMVMGMMMMMMISCKLQILVV